MNQNLKAILTFSAVFIFLLIAGFNSYKYWNKQDKEVELTRAQNERDAVNDSLTLVNTGLNAENERLKQDISGIGKEKERIKQVYTDKTKKDISRPATEQANTLIELIEK